MADEKKKNETTEETEVEETAETTPEPEAAETPAAEVEESDAVEAPAEDAAVAEPEAEAAPAEPEAEAAPETPAAQEKPKKSLKHVPRSLRRTRSKPAREKPATRKAITRIPKPEGELGRRQERRGIVVSDKGDKTIVVKVDVIKSHAKYGKVIRRSVKFHAHDDQNTAGVGDTVRIIETRPISKTKRWRLAEVVEKAR
jgi:small subunit ribosomal protein S17